MFNYEWKEKLKDNMILDKSFIGMNINEAQAGQSKADFISKMSIMPLVKRREKQSIG